MDLLKTLEACVSALEAGASVEECVARYPELQDDLRPLLHTAVQLRQAPRATPAPEFRRATRQRILDLARTPTGRHWRDGRVADAPGTVWWRRVQHALRSLGWRPAVVGAVAVLLLVILVTNTAVSVAAGSMPDSPLYPVKRASEQMTLAFTDDDWDRAELHLKFADRRLREAVAVPSAAGALVDDYQAQLAAALTLLIDLRAKGVDPSRLALLARPALARQQTMLQTGEAHRLPELTYVAANTALSTVQAWLDQLQPAAIVQARATPTPTAAASVAAPPTLEPSAPAAGVEPAATSPTPTMASPSPTSTALVAEALAVSVTPTSTELQVSAPVASSTATVPVPTPTHTPTVVVPAATATATQVPQAPTATVAPTATQTATQVPQPPTATPEPPKPPTATWTLVPPTATDTPEPYPPATETPTTAPPTATPVPPTATDTPEPYVPPPPPPSPTPPPPNEPPSVNGMSCDPCEINAGERAVISVQASDPEGDHLIVEWNAFPDIRGSTIQDCPDRWNICYLANYDMDPGDTATITITATIYDSARNSASSSVQIRVSGSN